MKRIVQLLACVGAITLLVLLWMFFWPLVDSEGEVTEGGFRELEIGLSKTEVMLIAQSPTSHSRLKLQGYFTVDEAVETIPSLQCFDSLYESDVWILSYPGIHNEIVHAHFENQELVKIRYIRDLLSP